MPGLFFLFSRQRDIPFLREASLLFRGSPPLFRDVRTKTFSAHVRGKITALVRKTGLSTHAREDFFVVSWVRV